MIRLLGDELADRGNNDYFTLKILQKLHEHKIPVEILISNHSIEFIEAYEKEKPFRSETLLSPHVRSMENLNALLEHGLVDRTEIESIVQTSYQANLRALSYSLSEDKQTITLYSHAGIGLNTIAHLAKKLGVDYNDATAQKLAATIDQINSQFQQYVQAKTVHTLYDREIIKKIYYEDNFCVPSEKSAFEFIMWNRNYAQLQRPVHHLGYKVNFVHGHDSNDVTLSHIYNLDSQLGKGSVSYGDYKVFYSRSREPRHNLFLDQLEKFSIKAKELDDKDYHLSSTKNSFIYQEPSSCAAELLDNLSTNYYRLINQTIDLNTFKRESLDAINKARPVLEQHRGWKQILGNLALAVAGMGVIYLVAGLLNKAVTGNFLFFKTDSAHKIDQIEKSIHSIDLPS